MISLSEAAFTPTPSSGHAGDWEASSPDENGNIYQLRVLGESLQPSRGGSQSGRGDGFSRDLPGLQEQTLVSVLVHILCGRKAAVTLPRGAGNAGKAWNGLEMLGNPWKCLEMLGNVWKSLEKLSDCSALPGWLLPHIQGGRCSRIHGFHPVEFQRAPWASFPSLAAVSSEKCFSTPLF